MNWYRKFIKQQNRKIRTIEITILLFLCFFMAFFGPTIIGRMTDRSYLGKIAYEDIVYMPYEIHYYDSFREKIEVMAMAMGENETIHSLYIKDKLDASEDDVLIGKINEQLQILYDEELIGEKLSANRIITKKLYESYSVSKESNQSGQYQNIFVWDILCETDKGHLSIHMDQEYYKLYGFYLQIDPEDTSSIQWWNANLKKGRKKYIRKLAEYWGVSPRNYIAKLSDLTGLERPDRDWVDAPDRVEVDYQDRVNREDDYRILTQVDYGMEFTSYNNRKHYRLTGRISKNKYHYNIVVGL